MPPRDHNRLTAWYLLIKDEWLPARVRGFREWWSAVREEPRLAWQTPQVRYGVIGLGVLAVVLAVSSLLDCLTLPPPADARLEATTANYHVVCSGPACGHHFLIERQFGFDRFPVECPKCKSRTGQRALRCNSNTCRGRYVPTAARDDRLHCTVCDAPMGPAP